MNLQIDFRSGIPIYLQVVERIKERIASGWLKPGNQLPTVRSLALELRVNFNTWMKPASSLPSKDAAPMS
jgi:GntR family transcriptional regulator